MKQILEVGYLKSDEAHNWEEPTQINQEQIVG